MSNEQESSDNNEIKDNEKGEISEKVKKGNILIFQLDVQLEEFEKMDITEDIPLHKSLNHDLILLFVDPEHSRIYIWEGKYVTTRMKFLSAQLAPNIRDKYGIDYSITTVDDGDETLAFKNFCGIEE